MATTNNDGRDKLLDDKKNLIVNDNSTGKKKVAAGAVVVIILLACAGIWFVVNRGDSPEPAGLVNAGATDIASTTGSVTGDSASYDAGIFSDGTARFYKYKYQGTEIRYFILKDSDGIVHAAFDACDVCWRAGKGYTQRGDVMVCNNCGREFPSDMIGKVSGGCNPAPLVSTVSGGRVTVMNSDIIKGLQYFRGI